MPDAHAACPSPPTRVKLKAQATSGHGALTPAAQTALLTACDVLADSNTTKMTIDTASGNTTVLSKCFMKAFEGYRANKSKSFPVPATEIDAAMEEWARDDDPDVPSELSAHSDD